MRISHSADAAIDDNAPINDRAPAEWVAAVEAELAEMKDVRIMRRTTVFGTYDGGTYGAVERVSDHLATAPSGQPRQRLWRIVAKQAVLASGATERPIVFGGNDRPGVMLAGAVRAYLNRYGVVPGQKAVVFGNNDSAATTVTELDRAGVEVVALVDCRPRTVRTYQRNCERCRNAVDFRRRRHRRYRQEACFRCRSFARAAAKR